MRHHAAQRVVQPRIVRFDDHAAFRCLHFQREGAGHQLVDAIVPVGIRRGFPDGVAVGVLHHDFHIAEAFGFVSPVNPGVSGHGGVAHEAQQQAFLRLALLQRKAGKHQLVARVAEHGVAVLRGHGLRVRLHGNAEGSGNHAGRGEASLPVRHRRVKHAARAFVRHVQPDAFRRTFAFVEIAVVVLIQPHLAAQRRRAHRADLLVQPFAAHLHVQRHALFRFAGGQRQLQGIRPAHDAAIGKDHFQRIAVRPQVRQHEGAVLACFRADLFQFSPGGNQPHGHAGIGFLAFHPAVAVVVLISDTFDPAQRQRAANRCVDLLPRRKIKRITPADASRLQNFCFRNFVSAVGHPREHRARRQGVFNVVPSRHHRVEEEVAVLADLGPEGLAFFFMDQAHQRARHAAFVLVPDAVVVQIRKHRALHGSGQDHADILSAQVFTQFHPEGLGIALSAGPVQNHVAFALFGKGIAGRRRHLQGVFPGGQVFKFIGTVRSGAGRGGQGSVRVQQVHRESGNRLLAAVRRRGEVVIVIHRARNGARIDRADVDLQLFHVAQREFLDLVLPAFAALREPVAQGFVRRRLCVLAAVRRQHHLHRVLVAPQAVQHIPAVLPGNRGGGVRTVVDEFHAEFHAGQGRFTLVVQAVIVRVQIADTEDLRGKVEPQVHRGDLLRLQFHLAPRIVRGQIGPPSAALGITGQHQAVPSRAAQDVESGPQVGDGPVALRVRFRFADDVPVLALQLNFDA